jgi:hypothetical protein
MARMNISVPEDLKKQMDAIGERINWSGVAQRAFEKEILTMEARQQVEDIDGAVARLQASKAVAGESSAEFAKERGRKWAMTRATYPQLKAIGTATWDDDLDEGLAPDLGRWATSEHENELCDDVDTRDARDFWEIQLDTQHPEVEAAYGFLEGVLEVWEEVKDQI